MHRAQSVTLLWLAYRIGVVEQCCQMVKYNTIFYKNGVIFHACVHERGRIFPGWPLVDFSKTFSMGGGPKVVKFAFYHSKLRKQPFC